MENTTEMQKKNNNNRQKELRLELKMTRLDADCKWKTWKNSDCVSWVRQSIPYTLWQLSLSSGIVLYFCFSNETFSVD